jgi:preprotein translocase subunit SecG
MFTFLLILQTVIAASLVGVILMQRSEGGGLGVGSSSAGLMTARGAADFLTRATAILATLFVGLSIFLAGYATMRTAPREIDTSLAKQGPATAPATGARVPGLPGNDVPLANDDPLAGIATQAAGKAPAPATQAPRAGQAQTNSNEGVPLAQ